MLTLDPRVGSGDLEIPLRQLNVPVEVVQLAFGDAQIIGRGPEERPVLVGVEIKKVPDLLQSLMDKRLTGYQLPGLVDSYEVPMLLIEGIYSANERRELVVWSGKTWKHPAGGSRVWVYEELEERLATIVHRAGVLVDRTPDRRGTAAWLAAQHRWWVGKPWDAHNSHQALRLKTLQVSDPFSDLSVSPGILTKMKVVADLVRGVGTKRARALAQHFPSPQALLLATPSELMEVEGIGEKLARDIWAAARRIG